MPGKTIKARTAMHAHPVYSVRHLKMSCLTFRLGKYCYGLKFSTSYFKLVLNLISPYHFSALPTCFKKCFKKCSQASDSSKNFFVPRFLPLSL